MCRFISKLLTFLCRVLVVYGLKFLTPATLLGGTPNQIKAGRPENKPMKNFT
jgi:hypothetical protein